MTHTVRYDNIQWHSKSLIPPIGIRNVLNDLAWHWGVYRSARLGALHTSTFLFLRVLQIVGYRKGWKRARAHISKNGGSGPVPPLAIGRIKFSQ